MRKIYLIAIAVLFVLPLFSQDETTSEDEIVRLNKIINIIVEQNDRLKAQVDSFRKILTPPVNAQKRDTVILKPQQLEVIKAMEARMIKVEGGTFTMGCTDEKDTSCYYWEKPAHKVTLRDFYIGKFAVTQKEWEALMGYNPNFKNCAECPVENITWQEAHKFVEKLSLLTGKNYRLPTEAEWEYAAKGGNKSKGYKYAGSNNLDAVGWYHNNSGKKTHPVGKLQPNELGLYDMTGNVWQWCSDWFHGEYYSNSPVENPKGPDGTTDNYKAVRGGSWWYEAPHCRVINRDRYPVDAKDDDVGFRIARD